MAVMDSNTGYSSTGVSKITSNGEIKKKKTGTVLLFQISKSASK